MQAKPIILKEGTYDQKQLALWKRNLPTPPIVERDIFTLQLRELYEIRFPGSKSCPRSHQIDAEGFYKSLMATHDGDWIYYPWNGTLIHAVNENDLFELRTNRNRDLITTEEQTILRNACIGVTGLSVGSNIALGLAYQGIAQTMKLAEFDTLETANLNRIRAGIADIGTRKLDLVAQQLYAVDPHALLMLYPNGLDTQNLSDFAGRQPAPQIIFDEIDDFEMKIRIRLAAREAKIPVLMFASVDDRVVIDVERYDMEPERPILHGLLGSIPDDLLSGRQLTDAEKHAYAVQFVGKENVSTRALQSIRAIGTSLAGRPQLNATVTISGGIATYLTKRLLLGDLASGRVVLDFASFEPEYDGMQRRERVAKRAHELLCG